MTQDELAQHVWDSLPVTKHFAGRRRVNRIVAQALATWPVPVLAQCDVQQSEVFGKYFARTLERHERAEYGMGFLASIILATLISEIVKRLIAQWWQNREAMMEAVS